MTTERTAVDLVDDAVVGQFARAALIAALMGASVVVTIPNPFSQVPYTLAGLLLGPVWGTASMLLYLAAGAVGAPVFAGMSAGLGVLVGDTAGYLWSYPIAAGLIGLAVHRGTDLRDPAEVSVPVLAAILGAATILIYAMGVGYAAWLLELELWEAIVTSALPFVPGELLKMAAAIAIVKSGRIAPIRS